MRYQQEKKEFASPRRGIEPRSPAWQAGILTTILSRTCVEGSAIFGLVVAVCHAGLKEIMEKPDVEPHIVRQKWCHQKEKKAYENTTIYLTIGLLKVPFLEPIWASTVSCHILVHVYHPHAYTHTYIGFTERVVIGRDIHFHIHIISFFSNPCRV